jgi:RNA polymerase sigma factor (sigma-70 family)
VKIEFSDKELLRLIRTGDDYCFKYLYEKHIDLLFNYGSQMSREKELVEDTIQDIFVELWNKKERLPEIKSFKAYLLRCVRYKLLRRLRKGILTSQRIEDMEEFNIELPVENMMISTEAAKETISRVRQNVNLLPNKQREVIFHIFYHDLGFDEVASVMDLSKKTIYNLLHSAIKTLRLNIRKEQIEM